jgi:hypothetical protein
VKLCIPPPSGTHRALNETDATPRKDGHHPPSEQGDSVDWAAVTPYRGRTPLEYESDRTITSISRRFAHGKRAETTVNSPTGEIVTLGEPHWYVTVSRDRFPEKAAVSAEYDHYVFPDAAAFAAWFGEDGEVDQ